MNSPSFTVDVYVHGQTPNAVRVSLDATLDRTAVWLPRSIASFDPPEFEEGDEIAVTAPEWFLIDKELV
jgi:hypothetical protein